MEVAGKLRILVAALHVRKIVIFRSNINRSWTVSIIRPVSDPALHRHQGTEVESRGTTAVLQPSPPLYCRLPHHNPPSAIPLVRGHDRVMFQRDE